MSSSRVGARRAAAGTPSTGKHRGGGRGRAGSAAASFTRRFAPDAAGDERGCVRFIIFRRDAFVCERDIIIYPAV